jgi:hypothetical protein
MGIRVLNIALTNTLAAMRTTGIAQTLTIEYAEKKDARPGTTFVENAQQLVTFLDNAGWPKTQEIRVHWAASPPPPASFVTDVRNALMRNIGARAYTSGDSPAFSNSQPSPLMGHEATHVVQQNRGRRNE